MLIRDMNIEEYFKTWRSKPLWIWINVYFLNNIQNLQIKMLRLIKISDIKFSTSNDIIKK